MSVPKPYEYQIRVGQHILAGKSVVLQAPTGAGKTAAALAPFIHAQRTDIDAFFPTKCIYTVPMRVLANQFVNEFQSYAEPYARKFRRALKVTIQTGERPEDRRFDQGDIVFCTVDQFLSSYLTMPYGLSDRLANLNAGALVGAYLVFDEFHLLDPQSTLPTVLYALKQLSRLAPVLLMTATFSRDMLDALAHELSAEVVTVSRDEVRGIETRDLERAPRQRIWAVAGAELNAEAVLAAHQQTSIAICNTVGRAQRLFRDLKTLIKEQEREIEPLLLHSRFLKEDRRRIEERLHVLLGKNAERTRGVILVATQAVEVGVDITCEVLHTDLAPASSLIQRAGRCARFPGEQGRVVVYPVPDYAPYGKEKDEPGDESPWVGEMRAAFDWLKRHHGAALNFEKEQELVNAVAAPRDRQILEDLSAGREMRADKIRNVLQGERQGNESRLLVRDVDSRLLLIHSQPDDLILNPLAATGFNVATRTLYGMVKEWLGRESDAEWRVQQLIQDEASDRASSEDRQTEYGWKPLTDASLLWTTRALVVHPALAGYWPDEGLVPEKGHSEFQSTWAVQAAGQTLDGIAYRLESYEDHVRRVLKAFEEAALPEMRFPARTLERCAGWPDGTVVRAAWLACLFHDVGKLQEGWQRWAHAYQERIGKPVSAAFAIAHTDYDPQDPAHRAADKAMHARCPKPPHAGPSTRAVGPLLVQAMGRDMEVVIRACFTAMVRHHAPFSQECNSFRLVKRAAAHIQATLEAAPSQVTQGLDVRLLKSEGKSPQPALVVTPDEDFGWLAYLLLVRALRRADQEGTATGTGSERG